MAQWTNFQRIEKFKNLTRLYATCEKSDVLYLAKPSLTAGWQSGRLADKIWARLGNLKAYCRSKYSIFRFLAKVLHCFNNLDALLMLFQASTATRLFYGA